MKIYRTASGSIYYVDGARICRAQRSDLSGSERMGEGWQTAESVSCDGVGHSIIIIWGLGKDEHSDSPKTLLIGDDDEGAARLRTTFTSPVVEILDPQ